MRRWLGWFALAVIIGMQAGTVLKPLGTVGETRVADWVDLLTPFATHIEGGVPWLGLAFLGVGVVCGFLWRPAAVSRLLFVVGGVGLLLLIGWGAYWLAADGSLFPELSELGWI